MIRSRIPAQESQVQKMRASMFTRGLIERFDRERAAGTPRSQAAWSAEENRLGSWNTGVGSLFESGVGQGYASGVGRRTFLFDPEEVETEDKQRERP